MAILSFKLDQLFTLLVPELVVAGAVIFPSEPDFVQNSLSILSKFVCVMMLSLHADPIP
jgi:hypothetical protein